MKLNQIQSAVLAAFAYDASKEACEISDQNDSGYQVSWWSRDRMSPERLYFRTQRRDAKVYIAFKNAETCSEPTLHVSIYNPNQPTRWLESQTAILRDFYYPALAGLNRFLAEAITKLPAPSPRDFAEDGEFVQVS